MPILTRPTLFGAIAAAIFCLLSWLSWTLPLDRLFYDLSTRAILAPTPQDVVLIAIDDKSLVELGRWPWPRERHVQLLRRLNTYEPRGLALDVIFVDPDPEYPDVDTWLAESLAAIDNSVLPVFVGQLARDGLLHEMTPLPLLQQAADALGHVHVEVDSDGIARGIFLQEGLGPSLWPHFGLSFAKLIGHAPAQLPGATEPSISAPDNGKKIFRNYFNLVPFAGPQGSVKQVSYVDVINGQVPDNFLRGKLLFLGATASGIGDYLSTPVGRMSGVEFNINVFNAISEGVLVQPADRAVANPASALLVFLLGVAITRLATRWQLAYLLAAMLLLSLGSVLLLRFAHLWHSAIPMVMALLLAYTLWGWVRLYALLSLIRGQWESVESIPIQQQPGELPVYKGTIADEDIARLSSVFQQARDSRALIDSAIDDLATGVLVSDFEGNVLVQNRAALTLLDSPGLHTPMRERVASVNGRKRPTLAQLYDGLITSGKAFETEGKTRGGNNDVLIRGRISDTNVPLVIVDITDTTNIKASQRKQAEALNFLSHDLRAPLTSVLALIDKARFDYEGREVNSLFDAIEKFIRTNLSYAENYILLSRLEQAGGTATDHCDLTFVVDEAMASIIQIAHAKSITLEFSPPKDDIWLYCQRTQLVRAVMNLLDNAVKYSPIGERVVVRLRRTAKAAVIDVLDRGPGVKAAQVKAIFESYKQGTEARPGFGLGLRYVAAVASAHNGSIAVYPRNQYGAWFCLSIPFTA